MKNQNQNSDSKKEKQELPDCCRAKPKKEPKNIWQGIIYGSIPHVGCIAFIIGSILGVTVLTSFFKPLLMNRNFFYILILISLMFATISAMIYLNRNGFLSGAGIRKKWKYLATMYGTTIGVNLLLFMVIFPLVANISAASSLPSASSPPRGADGSGSTAVADFASLKLKVDIPCPGHAPLIIGDLKTINGVQGVQFSFPNNFDVTYDPAKTSKQEILGLSVFNEYKATVLSESNQATLQQDTLQTQTNTLTGSAGGCGCGGCGGCGGAGSATGTCGVKY